MISAVPQTAAWRRQLDRAAKDALPRARVATVNALARASLSGQRRELAKMTLRNRYTEGSLRISLAKVRSSGAAGNAIIGTVSPYLPLQERGGIRRPVRGRLVPVPTRGARGGNWRAPVPRRLALGPQVRFGETKRSGKKGRSRARSFFVLVSGPRMRRPGVFLREGRRLLKIRTLMPRYHVEATRWHTGPVRKYATHSLAAQVFIREAKKLLGQIR
ncbi:MAG TPA: hypothetical protein VFH17_08545 [Coriobacteriia bacterium]|nr:hypothetical protein [Coriobacteriia bacterium]